MDVSTGALRWSRLATLMAGIGLVVAACGTGGGTSNGNLAANQILRVNINTEPNSLDPGQEQYAYEGAIGATISQALLKVKADLSDVQGGAAESWDTSSDGLTWTFHLRKNAKWSDGKPVKGADFVYAWQRILDPRLAASYADPFFDGTVAGAADYSNLDVTKPADVAKIPAFLSGLGLSAPDDNTFVVKLQQPAPYFKWIASLWMSAPVRKDVVDQYGSDKWASSPTSLITNGQYKVSEMVSKDHITLVPNQYYWGGQPTIKQIINYEIADDNQAYSKYQTGELDVVNIPLADTDLVKNDAKLKQELKVVPQLTVFWMDFNLRKAPFNNKQARLAFSKAIDRTLLVQNVGKGRWSESPTFIPKGMNGYKPDLGSVQKFDAAAAKTMLQGAGVGDPASLTIDFLVRNSTANVQLGQFIQDQLQNNLGVKVKLDVIDSKTVTQRLRKHDYQLYVGGWGADYPDDQDWFDIWMTGSGNVFGGYSNPEYDSTVKKADAERDASKRQALYDKAQKILIEDAGGGFLYQRNYWMLKKPYVQGLLGTPIDQETIGDQFWGNVSIAQH
ncbi:MAG: peptide ABC transporter substrate-binding protein [Candidatus Dormibacteraeota bacterium]|nr:peptide ABC transporter substrate-binding protein [Candidatus Dormibacteraeota bacterium]